jgi:hypothetical protein
MRSTDRAKAKESTMHRKSVAARLAALLAACCITGVVVFVHAADLDSLGGHPVAVAMPHTDASSAA